MLPLIRHLQPTPMSRYSTLSHLQLQRFQAPALRICIPTIAIELCAFASIFGQQQATSWEHRRLACCRLHVPLLHRAYVDLLSLGVLLGLLVPTRYGLCEKVHVYQTDMLCFLEVGVTVVGCMGSSHGMGSWRWGTWTPTCCFRLM